MLDRAFKAKVLEALNGTTPSLALSGEDETSAQASRKGSRWGDIHIVLPRVDGDADVPPSRDADVLEPSVPELESKSGPGAEAGAGNRSIRSNDAAAVVQAADAGCFPLP